MEKHLHIICLNVPYPVNYGGVFDLYYKLPALQKQGVRIHLHCYEYGRGEQKELDQYCASVHYYKRETGIGAFSFHLPYIVSSRNSRLLLSNLLQDDHPILMEGVHCTYLLNDKRFADRKTFVRLHNVEHVYYGNLYNNTTNPFKKLYYAWESRLLQQYEKKIATRSSFLSVIENDAALYQQLGSKDASFLPLFLPPWQVQSLAGKGSFCLYHGDLSVAENEHAATWLMQNVFNDIDIPFVIAGKNPPARLHRLVKGKNNMCLVGNPGNNEMQDMIAKAHMHIIPSFNATGIKLKLVNALFNGRHCIVNNKTVKGTGLEAACIVANDAAGFKKAIEAFYFAPFEEKDVTLRHQLLDSMFDNNTNAEKLVKKIWG